MKTEVNRPPRVAICQDCRGTGESPLGAGICPQCEGSGRVIVSSVTTLKIRPYRPHGQKPIKIM